MLVVAIAVCEVSFWAFLGAGLVARYLLRRPRLGTILLVGAPVADVLLLALTAVDLDRGTNPTRAHALAAVYVGVSLAFGHSLVRWADARFAHRFAGGPQVRKPRRTRAEKINWEWREWGRAVIAWAISCALLGGLALVVGNRDRAQPLLDQAGPLSIVVLAWLVFGPVWTLLTPDRAARR